TTPINPHSHERTHQPSHRQTPRPPTEKNDSQTPHEISTPPFHLPFLHHRHSRARPCHSKTIVPDRFDHPTRHVSTNSRNRGSGGSSCIDEQVNLFGQEM